MRMKNARRLCACLLVLMWTACGGGDTSEQASCTTTENEDGSITLQCGDGDAVTLKGPQGELGADGAAGQDGMDGVDGMNGQTAAIRVEPATTEQCAYGGEVVYTGYDLDGSGELEQGEETQNFIVCQGAPGDGKTALVVSSMADLNDCPTGGHRVEVGLDNDQSGALEASEILDMFTVCNGETGRGTLIEVTVDGAQNCAAGGDTVDVGVDVDGDGTLSAAELSGSFEVCDGQDGTDGTDGVDGADGQSSLLKVTAEPAGANCASGGQKIEVGVDQNNNGSLDVSEIDSSQTAYICDPTAPMFQATQVSAGYNHTCAVTNSGGVKCWGNNDHGNLGDGTTNYSYVPIDVTGLTSDVAQVVAGYNHTCALTNSGGVKCWGYNNNGQLGDGTIGNSSTPVDVTGLTSGVTQVSVGEYHSCVVTSAGGVKCWGYNNFGQLGNGTTNYSIVPIDVPGLTSGVTQVSAGRYYTCALTNAGGVKCWGFNNSGNLGNGTTANSLTPVDVTGLTSDVTHVSAGELHACAVTGAGGVKCWGRNSYGSLGNGTTNTALTPVDVMGLDAGVTQVSAGRYHTCAMTGAGGVKCWGANNYGQIGQVIIPNQVPQSVRAVSVAGMALGVIQLTAGSHHTCVVTGAGGAKCWGFNIEGQLGDGTTSSSHVPIDVYPN